MNNGVKAAATTGSPVIKEMSFLDRWLAVWILLAMGLGLALGRFVPRVNTGLNSTRLGWTSLPTASALLVRMYPTLAKVRYNETQRITCDRKLIILSRVLNWALGPLFMFLLAWVFLPHL